VSTVASGVGIHADLAGVRRCVRRVHDQEVMRSRILGEREGSVGFRVRVTDEAVSVIREVFEIQLLRFGRTGGVSAAFHCEGTCSGCHRDAQAGLRIERRTDGAFAVMVDHAVFADDVTIHIDVSTREGDAGCAGVLRFAEQLLVVAVTFQAVERVLGRDHDVAGNRVSVHGLEHGREPVHATHEGACADDVIHFQRIARGEVREGRVAGIEDVIAREQVDEHHEKLLGFQAAHPCALLGVEPAGDFSTHAHELLGAFGEPNTVACPIDNQLVRADEVILVVVVGKEAFLADVRFIIEPTSHGERDFRAFASGNFRLFPDKGIGSPDHDGKEVILLVKRIDARWPRPSSPGWCL